MLYIWNSVNQIYFNFIRSFKKIEIVATNHIEDTNVWSQIIKLRIERVDNGDIIAGKNEQNICIYIYIFLHVKVGWKGEWATCTV